MVILNITRAVAAPLSLSVSGDVLTINGQAFDFTDLPEGGELPTNAIDCPYIAAGSVRRVSGDLIVPLIVPYSGGDLPEALWTPAPIEVSTDGPVTLPAYEVTA